MSEFAEKLKLTLKNELCTIPLDNWGYFFPALVAMWRFIEEERPGSLGTLEAGFNGEPYFIGEHAQWFFENIVDAAEVLDIIEPIMYEMLDGLPKTAVKRGFAHTEELQPLDSKKLEDLGHLILGILDKRTSG